MKNNIIFIILLFALPAIGQIQLLQKDTLYRFRWDVVEEGEEANDTLTVKYFPERYVSKSELQTLVLNQLNQHNERIRELQRLVAEERRYIADYISHYDKVSGAGAYLAFRKQQAAEFLTGNWTLKEKGVAGDFGIAVSATGAVTGDKTGTIAMNDTYDIVATGLFNFTLEFAPLANGNLRAVRNTANGQRTFILKKAAQ